MTYRQMMTENISSLDKLSANILITQSLSPRKKSKLPDRRSGILEHVEEDDRALADEHERYKANCKQQSTLSNEFVSEIR